MKKDTGILLVGHGSRIPYNKRVIKEVAEKYAKTMPEYNVEIGFMELVEPNIPTAFNKLKKTGVKRIIVNPIFLAHGMHTKVDIPTILTLEPMKIEGHGHSHGHGHHHHHHEREAKSEPVEFDGEIIYLEPLGADDKIVDIVEERINNELSKYPDASGENTGILLAGHGSSLPYNNEVIETIAEKYIERTPGYPIEAGFMRLSKPSIPESFNKIKDTGVERVIVVPVFLAEGIHTKLDIPTTLNLEPEPIENYPEPNVSRTDVIEFDGEIIYTRPLGADDKIVEIVSERIKPYLDE
jgi:sirohydrochlorin cobaltochelatase